MNHTLHCTDCRGVISSAAFRCTDCRRLLCERCRPPSGRCLECQSLETAAQIARDQAALDWSQAPAWDLTSPTRAEVEELKIRWISSPNWVLEQTHGFARYAEELAAFRQVWLRQRQQGPGQAGQRLRIAIEIPCDTMGCASREVLRYHALPSPDEITRQLARMRDLGWELPRPGVPLGVQVYLCPSCVRTLVAAIGYVRISERGPHYPPKEGLNL